MVSYFFSSSLSSKQLEIQHSISAIIEFSDENNQIENVEKLINLSNFHVFSLKKDTKEIFSHNIPYANVIVSLISPKVTVLTNKFKTTVSYQINGNDDAALILKIILVSILASLAIIFVACSLSVKHSKRLVFVVNKKIKDGIAQVISMSKLEPDDEVIDIPELASGLKKVEALISSHVNDASQLEKKAYIDPVTKLENRNRFIQFFANDENQVGFGVLAITRCSELQTINQIQGYGEGDKYIRRVADIIKGVTVTYRGASVYRLNSSDFATLLPNVTLKKLKTQLMKYRVSLMNISMRRT